jgi:hypothetical protein
MGRGTAKEDLLFDIGPQRRPTLLKIMRSFEGFQAGMRTAGRFQRAGSDSYVVEDLPEGGSIHSGTPL